MVHYHTLHDDSRFYELDGNFICYLQDLRPARCPSLCLSCAVRFGNEMVQGTEAC